MILTTKEERRWRQLECERRRLRSDGGPNLCYHIFLLGQKMGTVNSIWCSEDKQEHVMCTHDEHTVYRSTGTEMKPSD